MRQDEHGPVPCSSEDLPKLWWQFRSAAHVVAPPATQHGTACLDDLVHDWVRAGKSDHPVHPIVWPGDKAVQRHGHVPQDFPRHLISWLFHRFQTSKHQEVTACGCLAPAKKSACSREENDDSFVWPSRTISAGSCPTKHFA